MDNKELIEKLAVIMDRLDRMERKIDELSKKQNIQYVPQTSPTYPLPQIWYEDKGYDWNKITCEELNTVINEFEKLPSPRLYVSK